MALVTLFEVAEIVAPVEVVTGVVVIVNVVELFPPVTVTLAGTLATDGFELESATGCPAAQTLYEKNTVAVTRFPPFAELLKLRLLKEGGVTVEEAFKLLAPEVAVKVTLLLEHCAVVVIGIDT